MDLKEFDFALAQLRHLYKQMNQGIALDSRQAAQGLLSPAIQKLEICRNEAPDVAGVRAALKPEIEALYSGIDRLAQAQQIVVTALDSATTILQRLSPSKEEVKNERQGQGG